MLKVKKIQFLKKLLATFLIGCCINVSWSFDALGKDSKGWQTENNVYLPQEANLADYFSEDITGKRYIIQYSYDLGSYAGGITVGDNCKLVFKRGRFYNGRLKCGNIYIEGKKTTLKDVYIDIAEADSVMIKDINAIYSYATDDFIRISNSNNIQINNVRVLFDAGNSQLDGNYIEAEGFDLSNCENISFSKCSILNSKSHYIDSEHGSLKCKDCKKIKVNQCYSSGGHNEIFNFIGCEDVSLTNIKVDGGSGSAITTQGGRNFSINNCKSYNVGASGFSLNSREMRITNCVAKDWRIFNGFTLGHIDEGLRAGDIVVSNCKMILTNSYNSHRKCALGGVIDGQVTIKNCEMKVSRICSFDGINLNGKCSLTIDNSTIQLFEGDSLAEYFRASDVPVLTLSNNLFKGKASIAILGFNHTRKSNDHNTLAIRNNRFKRGAEIKNVSALKGLGCVVYEGNIKDGKAYNMQ